MTDELIRKTQELNDIGYSVRIETKIETYRIEEIVIGFFKKEISSRLKEGWRVIQMVTAGSHVIVYFERI